MKIQYILLLIAFSIYGCNIAPDYALSDRIPEINKTREAEVLSAFFGLDNDLPLLAVGISPKAPGKDGMPLVFSHELDPSTLDETDFKIKTSKGKFYEVDIVTLRPAIEVFELRTVLLIGDYGDAPDNEPIEVEIVGDLLARSGQNFKGQKIAVTPLVKGPFLSYAEYFKIDGDYPFVETGRGCDCPKSTTTVVRTVWAGGVRAMDGEELGAKDLQQFSVTLQQENIMIDVHPFQIGDTGDNDNNIDLCINEEGVPLSVTTDLNTAIDPRGDANEMTMIKIVSRW